MLTDARLSIAIATIFLMVACGTEPTAPVQRTLETQYPVTRTDDAHDASTDVAVDVAAADLTHLSDAVASDSQDAADEDVAETVVGPVCAFEPWDEGLIGGAVARVQFDPRVPGLAWATSNAGLMRSVDGGLTFEPRATGTSLTALAFPADDIKRIIGLSGSGLVESQDAGLSINPLALSGLGLTALAVSPVQPTRVWLGTNGGGVLRSDNGGASFSPANIGIPYGQVFAIAASPDLPDVALVGMGYRNMANEIENRGVILRTTNGGRSWSVVSDAVVWGNQIVFCAADPTRAFAAVRHGILESSDGGATWNPLPFLETRDVLEVALGAGGCDDLWATVYQDALYRIDLAAETISAPLRNGIGVEPSRFQARLAPHPLDPDVLLVATAAGIFRSSDGGESFSGVPGPATLSFTGFSGSFDRSGEVLLGTSGAGLWRRTGDQPWARVPELSPDIVFNIVSSPSDHGRIALATPGG